VKYERAVATTAAFSAPPAAEPYSRMLLIPPALSEREEPEAWLCPVVVEAP
jgi:hypothetical protein